MFPLGVADIQKNVKIDTIGCLDDILECDFGSFKLVLFDIKCYRLQMNERDPERIVFEHNNGFTMVNTMMVEPGT